jgi:hypothetical protein
MRTAVRHSGYAAVLLLSLAVAAFAVFAYSAPPSP